MRTGLPLLAVSLAIAFTDSPTRAASAPDKKPAQSSEDLAVNHAVNWELFIPSGGEGAKITKKQSELVSPSGNAVIELGSDRPARFGIYPHSGWMVVQHGETIRLTAWVKSDSPPVGDRQTRGVLLRATLRTADDNDYPGGHYYIGAEGLVLGTPTKFKRAGDTSTWTKLEGRSPLSTVTSPLDR